MNMYWGYLLPLMAVFSVTRGCGCFVAQQLSVRHLLCPMGLHYLLDLRALCFRTIMYKSVKCIHSCAKSRFSEPCGAGCESSTTTYRGMLVYPTDGRAYIWPSLHRLGLQAQWRIYRPLYPLAGLLRLVITQTCVHGCCAMCQLSIERY